MITVIGIPLSIHYAPNDDLESSVGAGIQVIQPLFCKTYICLFEVKRASDKSKTTIIWLSQRIFHTPKLKYEGNLTSIGYMALSYVKSGISMLYQWYGRVRGSIAESCVHSVRGGFAGMKAS